jgi:hypothetical protein
MPPPPGRGVASPSRGPYSIDFGDGEVVSVRIRSQSDFRYMLRNVGAAGLRRRSANRFPSNVSPLIMDLEDLSVDHEYLTWPRPAPGTPGAETYR